VPVPLFDTSSALAPLREALGRAAGAVLDRGAFVLGPEVEAFERAWAKRLGLAHAIGVANGTEAITIALRALGVGPGDEVVVPSFTFYASAEAIPPTGARPVFCDVDSETACVTRQTVAAALTPRTRAVIAVDLFGNVAPIPGIAELGVPVLEDAAQAAGSTLEGHPAGALGHAATFSFYPSKNLPACGDGGVVTTDDDDVAERVRTLRFHGSRDKVSFEEVGYNSRLDEIQAALLRVTLGALDGWVEARRAAGRAYEESGLAELVGLPRPVAGADPAWHLYVVRHPRADELAAALAERGVEARAYYRVPVHRQPAMASWAGGVDLPVTDELARTHLALPMGPHVGEREVEEVVGAVRAAGV
jgi:dTDP-4-amino-4,6-dideoxygalactose transaminase